MLSHAFPHHPILRLLSIQSHVVYGHVGNSAAVFPLQRMGHEVLALNTVQFSNHTGYGAIEGMVFPPSHIADLLRGLGNRAAIAGLDGLLSGYLGARALGAVVAEAAQTMKATNPKALYCCDPVMGDVGRGLFVAPDLVGFFRDVMMPLADIITPNQFELEQLTSVSINTETDFFHALKILHALGPKVIVVTSLVLETSSNAHVSVAVSDKTTDDDTPIAIINTPKLAHNFHGAGDVTAALFFANYLLMQDAEKALRQTAASLYGLLKITQDLGSEELALVAAQDEFVRPSFDFTPSHFAPQPK